MEGQNKQIKPLLFRIFRHAAYWTLNVLFLTIHFSSLSGFSDFNQMLLINLIYLPGGMIFAYFSVYYLIPVWFFRNRLPAYLLLQLTVLIIYPVLSGFIRSFVVYPLVLHETPVYRLGDYVSMIFILVIDMVPLAWVKITRKMIIERQQKNQIEKLKMEAELRLRNSELNLLRSQLHPHFLFNTLNNLYSLSVEKSEETPGVIIRISDLLSYVIYECNAELVPVEKEIHFIRTYTDLERIRYDDDLFFEFTVSGTATGKMIAPMLLFPFVENCFKHGASRDTGKPWVRISLQVTGDSLQFRAANSLQPGISQKPGGIGISNVVKRLELLYPGRYRLDTDERESEFVVSLEIRF